jgi:hypothetical protein
MERERLENVPVAGRLDLASEAVLRGWTALVLDSPGVVRSLCYNLNITNSPHHHGITSITILYADGSIVTTSGPFAPITAPALPSPEDVEIDVVLSDGSTKKFIPAA